ncbi:MAG: hypothetical protein HY869_16265 [Chloroflexi bacterium]|nr:hypothetical protein [Chloroflexota bacterium]
MTDNADNKPLQDSINKPIPILDGLEIHNTNISNEINKHVIDESGILINPDLLQEEQQSSLYERLGTAPLPYRKNAKHNNIPAPNKFKGSQKKKIPGSAKKHSSKENITFRDEYELRQDKLVKCPFCQHKTEYNVLFVHLQVSHPEMNPKIVMARFNKVYRRNNNDGNAQNDADLNELAMEYEKLKQRKASDTSR